MTLAPAAAVELGTKGYSAHVAELVVSLRLLPGVNSFAVTLPREAAVDAAPGDTATLTLDGGEGDEPVLDGTVRAVRHGLRATRVVAADGGADLAALRPNATYERQDAKAVVRALASDAEADIGRLDLDLALVAYAAHQGRTAAEHVALLADLAGAVASVDAGGSLTVGAPPATATLALRHGRELVACETDDWPGPAASRAPVGFGPAGSTQAPGALRHTDSALPSSAPAAGPDAVRLPAAVLRTPGVAVSAGLAAKSRAAAEATRIRGRAFLLPALRPGDTVDIQDLPDPLAGGPWLVTAVTHRLDATKGGETTFEARAAGGGLAGALGSLAGAALSAVGGLL